MDRFVTKTPTWKTLNYSSMAAQSLPQKKCITKNSAVDNKKKPLKQKQCIEIVSNHYDFDKRLADLLPFQHGNVENFNANSNDSGLSSSSSISPHHAYNGASNSTKLRTPTKDPLGNLFGDIDFPTEKENDTYMAMTRSPKSHKKVAVSGLQVEKTFQGNKNINPEVNNTPEKPLLKTNNMIMARIQKDFNSPSAASRLRAIKAMKSPTKSTYCQFDIPESEQTFHLPDPPSLQEIMRNIVVYVEVRSGEDNRSAGVRKVIEALGARVSLSLNRETTHVIFKDGLLSTYKKAIQLNIPIVSILWIEACKNQRRICDPKDYPISNLDRYENPELYTKMKRIKSMQPDSECNKRIRSKPGGTPKDSTPTQKTGNLKKTSTFIGGTPTSSTNKKKTDITQFFKKLEKPTPSFASKIDAGFNGTAEITESPATQLLNRIHSECYTPLNETKSKTVNEENNNNTQNYSANASKLRVVAKRTLDYLQADNDEGNIEASIRSNIVVGINATIEASSLPKRRGRPRRQSLMADCEIETATHCMNAMAISVSTPTKSKNRRRSSIHISQDMSLAVETPNNINNIETIVEEDNETEKEKVKTSNPTNRRRTLYAVKTMDETDLMKCETNKEVEAPNRRSTRRRTLYNSKTMEISDIKEVVNKVISNVSNRRRTCINFNSLELTEIPEMTDSKAVNIINIEKDVESKSIDLTNEVKFSTPPATKAAKPSHCRKTIYERKTMSKTNIKTFTPNDTAASSICLTPTNFQTGRVASSTLLEDSDNTSKLMATPTSNTTSGKLLEETGQSVTPLVFSSTRQPGKRRTLFDVSMDIITQRLQCINQSARRPLAPPTPSADAINILEKPISTPINFKKSNILLDNITPNSSTGSLGECNDNSDSVSVNGSDAITLKKRRKLFMPNEMLDTPTKSAANSANATSKTSDESVKLITHTSNIATNSSATKRRRTLMPISQPQITTNVTHKESISNTIGTPTVRKRRSTLDFEQIQTIKTKSINVVKGSSSATKNYNSQQQIKAKKTPVLACTNMHQQQIDVIREAINKLRLFVLESCVTNTTTHVVSLEPRRTLNLLRALARGLWILDYSWIKDSLKAGKWLPEESYELQDFSRAIEICRSERQAFGNNYKCELFRKFGAFYISSNCYPISKENMRELITLCGGHVVNSRQKARYIIGDANRTLEDKLYLTPYWVLDSITQMQLMQASSKYIYPLPDGRPASQPLQLEGNN